MCILLFERESSGTIFKELLQKQHRISVASVHNVNSGVSMLGEIKASGKSIEAVICDVDKNNAKEVIAFVNTLKDLSFTPPIILLLAKNINCKLFTNMDIHTIIIKPFQTYHLIKALFTCLDEYRLLHADILNARDSLKNLWLKTLSVFNKS